MPLFYARLSIRQGVNARIRCGRYTMRAIDAVAIRVTGATPPSIKTVLVWGCMKPRPALGVRA